MIKKHNLEFCQKYNYPKEIQKHFQRILDVLIEINPISIILIGSAARGELDYEYTSNNELRIYSDYEFVIIAKRNKEKEKAIEKKIIEIEKEISRNSSLFHIDFSFISLIKFFLLPKTLWTYELKTNSITLYGKNLQKRISEINIDNLDLKELNQHLIWRLWLLLLYLPKDWIMGEDLSAIEEEKYKHLLCRSGLDLSIIILPWEGVLLTSLEKRVNYILDNYSSLRCSRFLGGNFPEFLKSCWNYRKIKDLDSSLSLFKLYEDNINYYLRFLDYLLEVNNIQHNKSDFFQKTSQKSFKLFKDFEAKSKFYDFMIMLKFLNIKRIRYFKWFFKQKEGEILNSFFFIHLSFLNFLNNNYEKKEYYFKKSIRSLNKVNFNPVNIDDNKNFPEKWLYLRKELAEFMMVYYKWINSQRKHVELNLK